MSNHNDTLRTLLHRPGVTGPARARTCPETTTPKTTSTVNSVQPPPAAGKLTPRPTPHARWRSLILATLIPLFGMGVFATPALAGKGYALRGEFAAQGSALAVSETTNDIYLADGSKVEIYKPEPGATATLVSEFTGEKTPAKSFSAGDIAVDNCMNSLTKAPCTTMEDESVGDVYVLDEAGVIDKFSAAGKYEGQLTGTCEKENELPPACTGSEPIPFERFTTGAITVDSKGDLWLSEQAEHHPWRLDEFSDTGVFMKSFEPVHGLERTLQPTVGLAVDSTGDVYVGTYKDECPRSQSEGGCIEKGPERAIWKFSPSGKKLAEIAPEGGLYSRTSLAIDATTGNLFDNQLVLNPLGSDAPPVAEAVNEYGPFGEPASAPIEKFPKGGFPVTGVNGLAVDAADGSTPSTATVYASQSSMGKVAVMQFVELPEVVTGAASEQTDVSKTEASVKLSGTVNPEGIPVDACVFEYATSEEYETGHTYSHSEPCEQSLAQINAASGPENKLNVPVSVGVSGLEPGKLYHYRVSAGNARYSEKLEPGADATFGPPQLAESAVAEVHATAATVTAQVQPEQSPTEYYVQYGTSVSYSSETTPVKAGAGSSLVDLSEALPGLSAQSTYHFRFVARNASGVSYGPDVVFTTLAVLPPEASVLPDGRVYEMVSAPGAHDAEAYVPRISLGGIFSGAIDTELPFQVAPDGGALAFAGSPSGADVNGSTGREQGNEYLARRGPTGWEASDLQPVGVKSAFYQAFTSGLETAFVNANGSAPLVPQAPGEGYDVLYSSPLGSGSFTPLFTVKPPDRLPEAFGSPGVEADDDNAPLLGPNSIYEPVAFAGAAAGHVLFEANDALLAGTGRLEEELRKDVKNEVANKEDGDYLYDSLDGQLSLVDLLPGGTAKVAPDATFGGGGNDFSHAISTDGERVFWTDLDPEANTNVVYVREGGTTTVQVSAGPAQFWTASAEGKYAFYTEGEQLWRFDSEAAKGQARTELTPANAKVQGVIGASEDGEYVYFVADDGSLASGATGGQPNLYLYHAGATTFVATLSTEDNGAGWFDASGSSPIREGDWMQNLGLRTAEVTPDGHGVVFTSTAQVKTLNFPAGYDNEVTERLDNEGHIEITTHDLTEVYVYQAGQGVFCVSCDPSGAPPPVYDTDGGIADVASILPASWNHTYQMQWVSDDGDRVFFDSLEPLVGRDKNGTMDVYEWERAGTEGGSCPADAPGGGCIYLLSNGGGTQQNASYLLGASETGEDVFIATRSHLLAGVQGEGMTIYDARVDGYRPLTTSQCAGTACQGVPPAPPIFATPSSVTFAGPGNFPPPPPAVVVKPKPKPTKCKKAGDGSRRGEKGRCVPKKKKKSKAKKSVHTNRRAK
jgi:hypothetical protein